jgi:hypothetical protein
VPSRATTTVVLPSVPTPAISGRPTAVRHAGAPLAMSKRATVPSWAAAQTASPMATGAKPTPDADPSDALHAGAGRIAPLAWGSGSGGRRRVERPNSAHPGSAAGATASTASAERRDRDAYATSGAPERIELELHDLAQRRVVLQLRQRIGVRGARIVAPALREQQVARRSANAPANAPASGTVSTFSPSSCCCSSSSTPARRSRASIRCSGSDALSIAHCSGAFAAFRSPASTWARAASSAPIEP